MKILVTGSAGFIGSALVIYLLERGDTVIGIDNHNNYYDPILKEARLKRYINHSNYTHLRLDIADKTKLIEAFRNYMPVCVVNLAAQAGVRYSVENPLAYVESNIVGFANILEACSQFKVKHLVYASSSSVYGASKSITFSESDVVDSPLSIYAASKKSNELMAHAYSHLHELSTTGLRLFTVYGPWGRPDMALYKFTKSILDDKEILVHNNGNHTRDFTYIDDIIYAIAKAIDLPNEGNLSEIYNVGNGNPIKLMDFISLIEIALNKKAIINFASSQPGEMLDTCANVDRLFKKFNFRPEIGIDQGVKYFVQWYKQFYGT